MWSRIILSLLKDNSVTGAIRWKSAWVAKSTLPRTKHWFHDARKPLYSATWRTGKAPTDNQNGGYEMDQKRKHDEQHRAGPLTLSFIAITSSAAGVMTALCSDARTRCNSIIPRSANMSRNLHRHFMISERGWGPPGAWRTSLMTFWGGMSLGVLVPMLHLDHFSLASRFTFSVSQKFNRWSGFWK